MKRFVSILLSLVLALGMFSFTNAEEAAQLPQTGDAMNGFVVTDVRTFDMIGADIVVYEHEKTGAKVMFILNDDLNRTFEITFRTPCYTDKGIPHVFEHSVLDGSEKYPSKALFFNLSYQTYNTYMNAATYNFMTTYPVASLSEDQLLKYADFYTDSVFNPMVLEDESIFREEAWRYAMNDAESDLTIAGTVYSEMQGAYTINRAASLNYTNELFPGSTAGKDHGGKPEDIYTMTWDELKEYHANYYHPSNTLTCIYGKIEQPEAFLSLLDNVFSAYEAREFDLSDRDYAPISAPVKASYNYGLAADADTANGAIVYYGFVCEDCDEDDMLKLDFLTTLINDSSSVFQERMKNELPSAEASCYIDETTPETSVYFYATGINPEDSETFKQIVDESIADVIANGFEADAIDAIVSATKLDILLANESSSIGVDIIPTIAYYWASNDDMFFYMDYIDALDFFAEYATDGSLLTVAEKYLVGNERTALVTTVPVAGLKEENEAAFAAMLAEVKAGMTEEEIAEIVAATNSEDEPQEDGVNYVSQLTAVTLDSLPEDVRIFDISDTTDESGIRHINVNANTNGVGQTALLLDAQGLSQDQLLYFKLFVDMVGNLDTAQHTRQQLSSLQTRYLYNGVIRVSTMDEGDSYHPYMRCTFTALDEDLQAGYDLIYELLYETKLDDVEMIKNNVANLKNNLKRSINSNCYAIMLYRAEAQTDPTTAYFNYMNYLDYYDFLCGVEQLLETEPETVTAYLKSVQDYFANRTGAIAGFVGGEESAALNAEIADAFLMKLGESAIEKQEYDFGPTYDSEALIVDGSVMYNMYFASWEDMGLDGYNGAMDAVTAYVNDVYLYPLLRDQYGAYGVLHAAADAGVYMISYRDPNLLETFAVYESLPQLISSDEPDQTTLEGYVQSSYSAYATSNGELTDGFNALLNYVNGDPQDLKSQYMRELKSVDPETFKSYATLYAALCENAIVATSGSAGTINANAELFENILNPFAGEVKLADMVEDAWYYEAVNTCMQEGLINPLSVAVFGADEPATLGDLSGALLALIGHGNDQQDGVDTFAYYGVVPTDSIDTPITREQMALYTANFCTLVQIPVEETSVEEYTDADQLVEGNDGFVGFIVVNGGLNTEDNRIRPQDIATRGELCYMLYMLFIAE